MRRTPRRFIDARSIGRRRDDTGLPRRASALALVACLVVGLGVAMTGTAGAAPTDTPWTSPAIAEPAATESPASPPAEPADVTPPEATPAVVPLAHIWADNVNVRYCPLFRCGVRVQVDSGRYPYVCTGEGDRVTYGQYTNFYWTRISVDTDGDGYHETPGWVSDVFVSGGGNDEPAMQPTDWICGA
jgi:hypothetical protein